MLLDNKHYQLRCAIEEYRRALIFFQDEKFFLNRKYAPLISSEHYSTSEGSFYQVELFDTWVEQHKPGHFYLGKHAVLGSKFVAKSLQQSLEYLLGFTKAFFVEDKLFNKIRH